MAISNCIYEPFYDPFFTIPDFTRLFDPTWESRAHNVIREFSHREEPSNASGLLLPRMDLHESKGTDEMTATFELPGMKKEDVSIDVHRNRLVVSGQSTISGSLDKDGYAVRERRFGMFSRTIPLPTGIKAEDIKASMENGVLTLKFPKSQADETPRKITIA